MRYIFFWIISSVLASCAHAPQKKFEARLEALQCEEAFQNVPELQKTEETKESATWMLKNSVAYTYVGINYTAEVLWDVSVGTVGFVVLCLPVPVLAGLANASLHSGPPYIDGRGPTVSGCLAPLGSTKRLMSPPLGRNARKDTEKFRCPDVTPLAISLEKVSRCYENRKAPEDLHKALLTLENISGSEDFFQCVEESVQTRILKRSTELKAIAAPRETASD